MVANAQIDQDVASGFNQCSDKAANNRDAAANNPDNYRVFAEMSMSPATRWGPASPDKK